MSGKRDVPVLHPHAKCLIPVRGRLIRFQEDELLRCAMLLIAFNG